MPPTAPSLRVLLLGGSSEASALARRLAADPTVEVVYSLAGRTTSPRLPPVPVRVGGFGGVGGLQRWLREEGIAAVVDATHPFAAHMPHHAAQACARLGLPRLRLLRPGWAAGPGDRWATVADLDAAAEEIARLGARRVFLTTGRQELDPFARLEDVWFLLRAIDPPRPQPLRRATVILDRGPFRLDDEEALMAEHRVDVVVTKNSGGEAAAPKLTVARRLGLPVVLVTRPPSPAGPEVTTVDGAAAWCSAQRAAAGSGPATGPRSAPGPAPDGPAATGS